MSVSPSPIPISLPSDGNQAPAIPPTSTRRPCHFPGGCRDLCPDFEPTSDAPRRCEACGHLAGHHTTEPVQDGPTPLLSVQKRFEVKLNNLKSRTVSSPVPVASSLTAIAHKEVLSGYQSSSLPSTSSLRSASTSLASGSQGRRGFLGKGTSGSVPKGSTMKPAKEKLITISGLFFIPYAYSDQYKVINNSGVLSISCPSLLKAQKALSANAGYARITSKGDPVELDKNLDAAGTADLLA
ncbi:hypothetical protein FRC09_016996 [Ceratobasidium sp. 395]|nr:hypothetical protein FRC09_016996 [Ceratobasidium sp. 395]